MRMARIKPNDSDCRFHVYNRVAGMPDECPFGDREKSRFLTILHKLTKYYVIEVVSFVVLGNHYHITLFVPETPPPRRETVRRHRAHYKGKRKLEPDGEECERISWMLRDLSAFMHDLQQQFSVWFNGSRSPCVKRRGSLWADRFKSKLCRTARAVWNCLVYQIMNPVKAEITSDPAKYQFSCWGMWNTTGFHPFGGSIRARLLPYITPAGAPLSLDHFRSMLEDTLSNRTPAL